MKLTHLDKNGNAKFVDISNKNYTLREAEAVGYMSMGPEAFQLIEKENSKKGNVLAVAQLAGIMAGKKTHELIPLCHLIPIQSLNVNFEIDKKNNQLKILGKAKAKYNTGGEMEALTAVTIAALTVYDMIKSVDKSASIKSIYVLN